MVQQSNGILTRIIGHVNRRALYSKRLAPSRLRLSRIKFIYLVNYDDLLRNMAYCNYEPIFKVAPRDYRTHQKKYWSWTQAIIGQNLAKT